MALHRVWGYKVNAAGVGEGIDGAFLCGVRRLCGGMIADAR